jgi:hypothetical protein
MYTDPKTAGANTRDEEFEKALPDAWGFSVWFGLAAFFYAIVFFDGGNVFLFASGIALGFSVANFFIWYRIRLFKKKYSLSA